MATRSTFHAGQFVKVRVTSAKAEIGQIASLDENRATIQTISGFSVSRGVSALEPAWLVVLDLNGVLGFRKTSKQFKKRPHVDELLRYLFDNFVVGVWTSCTENNGTRIIADVFGEHLASRLIFRMFRDECTPNPTPDNKYGTFKDLRRVFDRFPFFDATNTIMVDDSEDKCSHRHNALCPTPYTGETEGTAADEGLREIMTVLDQVLAEGSFAPVRQHMLARWDREEQVSRTASALMTPVAGTPPLGIGGSSPPAQSGWDDLNNSGPPTGKAAPAMPSSSPFAGVSTGGGTGRGGAAAGGRGGSRHQKVKAAVRELACQDADDDDDAPTVGDTPPVGMASGDMVVGAMPVARGTPPEARGNRRSSNSSPAAAPDAQPVPAAQQAAPASSAAVVTSIQERMRAIALSRGGRR